MIDSGTKSSSKQERNIDA